VLNRALPSNSSTEVQHGLASVPTQNAKERAAFQRWANAASALAAAQGLSPSARQAATQMSQAAAAAVKAIPKTAATAKEKPITLGVGEPFMTTLTVVAYFALLITLPVIIYQLYAFVIPALKPGERRVALPATIVAPVLFIAGVVFAYLVVLPPAVRFLQGYNSNKFDIVVQAKSYYSFEMLTMLGIGLAFQLPLLLMALRTLGVITGRTLTKHWRYATVIIAIVAAAMPGADPVTTGLEMAPLVLLYLASIVLLRTADRRAAAREAAELASTGNSLDPT